MGRLAAGGLLQALQVTSPPTLSLGGFGFQILKGVHLKSLAAGLRTEIVGSHLMGKPEIFLVKIDFHQADRVNIDLGQKC